MAMDLEFLQQVPILGGLDEAVLTRIMSAARVLEVAEGACIIEEGALTAALFIVCEGELEICKRGRNGAEFSLATLKRGDCVGEMSLVDIQPRSASVRALEPTTLLVLDEAAVARLYASDLQVYTLLMLNIAREISRRLRVADQTLVDLGVAVQSTWGP